MAHCHFHERMHNLRMIQRQMRLLDVRLQMLRDKLCAARMHGCTFSCCCLPARCCLPAPCFRRRCIPARCDRTRKLCMMLNPSCCQNNLALIDVKGFDPRDISVTVKDGKVTVSAERKVECNTGLTKTCNYKKFVKQFSLPPGVEDKEVTYSVESKSTGCDRPCRPCTPKCCPYLCDC